MPRSGLEARRRLQQAALELYRGQGYDGTTTAEIAARAGVTERTYFRHFPDKREVLFEGETEFAATVIEAINLAPQNLGPLETLRHATVSIAPFIEGYRRLLEPRYQVIVANPALRERELTKSAALIAEAALALRKRDVPERAAKLAAQIGLAVLSEAMSDWLETPSKNLEVYLFEGFENLQSLVSSGKW